MAQKYQTPDLASNRIVKILSKPYGGMNEILSMVEVQMQFDTGHYDVIVLDTPPGAHFLDFLDGLDKIRSFFNQNFVEIFSYVSQKTSSAGKRMMSFGFINRLVSGGVKKLLGYLQKVTGADFIDDFIEAIQIIYKSREAFLRGLQLQDKLKSRTQCNWFLVTSVEQGKVQEAVQMKEHAKKFIHQDHFLILNKCLEEELTPWMPQDKKLTKIKESLANKEIKLKEQLDKLFPVVLDFPEILSLSPHDHIQQLTQKWNSYALQNK